MLIAIIAAAVALGLVLSMPLLAQVVWGGTP